MNDTLLPVPFHGATLALVDHQGEPFAVMRHIVEAMGLDWKSQFDKLRSRYAATVVDITTVAEDGKQRAMTCLPLRKLAGWLMTIHPAKVRTDLRERIRAFQDECDDALWSYWAQGQATRTPAVSAPPAVDPVADPKVHAAIRRKAYALSLACYEHNAAILTDWLRQADDLRDPAAAIERIHLLDLDHGKHVMVDLQLLHALLSSARTLRRASDTQMDALARIEAATGRQLQAH